MAGNTYAYAHAPVGALTAFTTQFNYLYANSDAEDAAPIVLAVGGTPFGKLLLAVFNSIFQVFLLCVAGYILAKNGILDKKTQKQINRLNVSLFTPALLFSKVAFYLTPEKLRELWIIPIWFVIVTCASMAVARVLGWTFGLRQSQRSFVAAAAMFMNSNALPIALMQSLVVSVPDLAWGSDDNKNAMLGRALTYLTMYSTLGMVVRYSYGVALLSRADTIQLPVSNADIRSEDEECAPLLLDHDHDQDGHLSGYASASTLAGHPSHKSISRPHSPSHSHSHSHSDHGDDRSYAAVPTAIAVNTRDYVTHEGDFVGSPAALSGSSPLARRNNFGNRNGDDDHTPTGTGVQRETVPAYVDAATQANTSSNNPSHTQPAHPARSPPRPTPPSMATIGAGIAERLARPAPAKRNTTFYNSFPNSPNRSRPDLPGLEDDSTDSESSGVSGSETDEEVAGMGMDIEAQTQAPAGNGQTQGLGNGNGNGRTDARPQQARGLSANSRRSLSHPRHHSHHHAHPHTVLSRIRHTLHRLYLRVNRTWAAFCSFMTVPLWSALLSLVVACAAPVKHALEQHLQPVNEAISTCGKCAVPLTLVVLGAYFYVPPPEGTGEGQVVNGKSAAHSGGRKAEKQSLWKHVVQRVKGVFGRADDGDDIDAIKRKQQQSAANSPRPKETLTVALAVLARMILTPLLLVPLMIWATSEDWHAVFEDPVFIVVNTLLLCSPPALTLAQITAAVSGDAFERLISRTIFWSYCIVTPVVTIGSVLLGLWLAKM
ncbi:hypothetical protein D9619_007661 [Psilocybe cf. subviscida]|uniref:Auxin efflux carrier n=1 Tax=Psilocybe cf. subviscida TaxID=2480587 RepID=A0A8H5ATP1_9AGAR|nr:hypothetical protein D9619_007661 [Psilocybe cf. subviscida]